MSKFIPEIYKRLGTTVSVDLGLKAELAAIHDDIKALPPQITGVQNNMDLKAQALTQAMHLDNGVTRGKIADAINEVASSRQQVLERVVPLAGTAQAIEAKVSTALAEFRKETALAQQRHETLVRLIDEHDTTTFDELTERSARTIEALVKLQLLLLQSLEPPLSDAISEAGNAVSAVPDLKAELNAAVEPLRGPEPRWTLPHRSKAFWLLHELIEDVAEQWHHMLAGAHPSVTQTLPPPATDVSTPATTA
ncbi:MAG TPA: hypothetical protein VFG86_03410 [Chloroflexota bacterium]|jgi:hypothetical protein|nr:hypothetical protein [Chloroflexota bacterium]